MRIVNATNKLLIQSDVTLPLVDKSESKSVTLKPGEFVFIEERGNNSVLRLFEQKKMLIVDDEEKPDGLSFCQVYNHFDLLKGVSNKISEAHEALREEVLNDERFPKAIREEFAKIKESANQEEPIELEVQVPESSINNENQINKGGRPKGSKNKSSKKKGKIGRPKKRGRKPSSKSKK
jgi:uncharacterized protein (UPF0147 family)